MSGEAATLAFDDLVAAPRARKAVRRSWLSEHGIVRPPSPQPTTDAKQAAVMPVDVELLARRLVAGAILFDDERPVQVALPMEVGPLVDLVGVLLDLFGGALRLSLAGAHLIEGRQVDPNSLPVELREELAAVLRGVAEFHERQNVSVN